MADIMQHYLTELKAQRDETVQRYLDFDGDKYEAAARSAVRFVQLQNAITLLENKGKVPTYVYGAPADE